MKSLKELESLEADFLSVEDIAELTGLSPQGIRNQAHEDKEQLGLPCIVCGKRIIFPREAVISFCRGRRRKC